MRIINALLCFIILIITSCAILSETSINSKYDFRKSNWGDLKEKVKFNNRELPPPRR